MVKSKSTIISLIFYMAYADMRVESERTYIGYLWWVLEPLLFLAALYAVFRTGIRGRGADFATFLFVGLLVWRWLESTVTYVSISIIRGKGLMQQVYLPKIIFPIVAIITNTYKFIFILILLLIYLIFFGNGVIITWAILPVLLLVQFLLVIAMSLIISAIVPFFQDLKNIVNSFFRATFFVSGIFFTSERIPEDYLFYYYLNPMASLIESYRDILLYNNWPVWGPLINISAISVAGILLGILLIVRKDHVYPKIV